MARKKSSKKAPPITQEQAEEICNKVDSEGPGYWLLNYRSDAEGTPLEPIAEAAGIALEKFEQEIEKLKEKFSIETV